MRLRSNNTSYTFVRYFDKGITTDAAERLARFVRRHRRRARLSVGDLAARSHLSRSRVYAVERGEYREIDSASVDGLGRGLEVDPQILFDEIRRV